MSRKEDKQKAKKRKAIQDETKRKEHINSIELKLNRCVSSGVRKIRNIYLFKTGENYYKIGVAEVVKNRLKAIQCGCPTEVEYIFSHPTYRALNVEQLLHAVFQHKQVTGEWFNFDKDEVVSVIQEIKKRCVISKEDYVEYKPISKSNKRTPKRTRKKNRGNKLVQENLKDQLQDALMKKRVLSKEITIVKAKDIE